MIKNEITDLQPSSLDLNGFYMGVVEDNKDPLKLGRVKARIFGIHTSVKEETTKNGISTEHLVWVMPVCSNFEGSVSGFGVWSVPLQGSHILIFFYRGDLLHPYYLGSIPGIPYNESEKKKGFNDPDGIYPVKTSIKPHQPNGLEESDFHRLSKGNSENTIVETKNENLETNVNTTSGTWNEPNSAYNTEYPSNKVIATKSGITIEIDDTPDNVRVHIYHPSNTYIEVDNGGNVVVKNNNDKYEIVGNDKYELTKNNKRENVGSNNDVVITGNETKSIGGDETKTVTGDKINTVTGNETENITLNKTLTVNGNYSLNITGNCSMMVDSNLTITSNGALTITGNPLTLNSPILAGSSTFAAGGTLTGGTLNSPTINSPTVSNPNCPGMTNP